VRVRQFDAGLRVCQQCYSRVVVGSRGGGETFASLLGAAAAAAAAAAFAAFGGTERSGKHEHVTITICRGYLVQSCLPLPVSGLLLLLDLTAGPQLGTTLKNVQYWED